MKSVSVVIVGIGGYGESYVSEILDHMKEKNIVVAGVVDPKPTNCSRYQDLVSLGIPFSNSMEEFYQDGGIADLAVISSPIQYHCQQTCTALANGSSVLCEKPVSASVDDVVRMMKERDKYGRFVEIGYQWSHNEAILELKKDIISGIFGKPLRMKTIVCWPRGRAYYSRNSWAGKIRDAQGNLILDSVANNATAHYIHNMFYLLGGSIDQSILPEDIEVELYRANATENFDTVAFRASTCDNVEILYYATHAVNETYGPVFILECEKANVFFDSQQDNIIKAVFSDGHVKSYGNPNDNNMNKLWLSVDAVRKEMGKQQINLPCGLEASISQTLCISAMHSLFGTMTDFPKEMKRYDEENEVVWVDHLAETFKQCYRSNFLPFDTGVQWARKGSKFQVVFNRMQ